jgi:hypothetical protein
MWSGHRIWQWTKKKYKISEEERVAFYESLFPALAQEEKTPLLKRDRKALPESPRRNERAADLALTIK